MRWGTALSILSIAASFLADPSPCAQPSAKIPHRIPRVESSPKVDGVLDDPLWERALVLPVNTEVRPGENTEAPVKTEVLLAYGPAHIFVGFRALDPEPARIRARYSDRDKIWDDDWVSVTFDTFNDERRAYEFYCNPLGVQLDRIEVTGGNGGDAWDAIWDSAGRLTGTGFEVEMAIPFSSLRFQRTEGDQVWGFDAVRSYPRTVRHHIGAFPRQRGNNCYLCQALKLVGFAGADPGKNFELDPTLVATYSEVRDSFPDGEFRRGDSKVEPGLTIRWSMTPNLTLGGALNPDFSQVESDAAQLDINTRFALYYPEKRPFFLEGMDTFETPLRIVHTRTMAQPAWGLKLTGKVGGNLLGAFAVRDEVTNLLIPSSQFSANTTLPGRNTAGVFRYRRDVGNSSTVGLFATDREGEAYSNRVFGMDAALRFSDADTLYLNAFGSQTRYPGQVAGRFGQPEGWFSGHAYDLMYDHSTRNWEQYVHYVDISDGFRADLGFVPQVGYSFLDAGVLRRWYSDAPGHWYNEFQVWGGYELTRDSDGNRLREVVGTFVEYHGPLQSWLFTTLYLGRQSYLGIPFDDDTLRGSLGFQPWADLILELDFFYGDDVDVSGVRQATRLTLSPEVALFAGRHFRLSLDHTYERLWVDAGRLYAAHLSELRCVYQFNVRTFLRVILQHADYSFDLSLFATPVEPKFRSLLSQVLFSYKVNPQTALYLGYSDTYLGDPRAGLTQTDRAVFLKIGYAWVR